MKYPDYFPKGCPPKEANQIEHIVYRICKNKEVSHSDFLSFYEMGLLPNSNDVKKYGISLDLNKEQLVAMLGMPAQKKRNMKCVAEGITKKELGVSLKTPSARSSSHITWWLKSGATPEDYFKCVFVKGDN